VPSVRAAPNPAFKSPQLEKVSGTSELILVNYRVRQGSTTSLRIGSSVIIAHQVLAKKQDTIDEMLFVRGQFKNL